MKNNKGMILSIYVYILLIFFLLVLATMLMVLNNTKLLANKMKTGMSDMIAADGNSFSIILLGDSNIYIPKGVAYTDSGYISQTNQEIALVATATTNLDINTLGTYTYTYTITYNDIDKTVSRTINVVDGTFSYDYTGGMQFFIAPYAGYYNLETWGAQGGQANATYVGGYGGYSKGVVYLDANQQIYIYVGGQGSSGCGTTICAGGYNGGGSGYLSADAYNFEAGGGGATHISKTTGNLSTQTLSNVLIVASGGGGGYYHTSGSNYSTVGGSGGGVYGNNGGWSTYGVSPAGGGTQTSGGSAGYRGVAGSYGLGGTGTSASGTSSGGGGGLYGGGASAHSATGGGSGYIGNTSLISYGSVTKSMYCYNCVTSSGYSNKTISTTNVSATATTNYAKSGNGYAKINFIGGKYSPYEIQGGTYETFEYTGTTQTYTFPKTGYYQVELWGAGSITDTSSVYGGYTKGIVQFNANDSITIVVGGAGITGLTAASAGGYNGGGTAYQCSDGNAASGGGATDIRFGGTSLNDRIMVAGGGGYVVNAATTYGYGGFLIGATGTNLTTAGTGGTQISGGTGMVAGTFGQGANGAASSFRAGGGGGYYGGGVSGAAGANAGAGGGSSFISGYAGVNAITSSASTTPTNNTKHYSSKYFVYGDMQQGVRNGNGKAKITYIGTTAPTRTNNNLNNVRYIKDCINGSNTNIYNHWVELEAIYNGLNVAKGKTVTGMATENPSYPYSKATDGDITSESYADGSALTGLQCVTVDLTQTYNLDEIGIWHYWTDGRTYNNNTTYVSSDNTNWTTVISNTSAETSQGKRVSAYGNYSSSGLTSYSIINIANVYTASFENTGWSGGAYVSTFKKYGSYSYSLTGTTSTAEVIASTPAVISTALNNTHIYYARVEAFQPVIAGSKVQFYWPVAEPYFGYEVLKDGGSWQPYSAVINRTSFTNGTYTFRIDYDNANIAGVIYFDGAMIIDLTATFGAGNEPTKAWCDANLPFIVGNQILKLAL